MWYSLITNTISTLKPPSCKELLHLIDRPCTLPLLCAYGGDGSQGYLPLPTGPIKKKAVLFICQFTLLISLERDAMYTHSCAATQTQGGKSSVVQHSRELLLWYARMYNGHSVLASTHRLLTSLDAGKKEQASHREHLPQQDSATKGVEKGPRAMA